MTTPPPPPIAMEQIISTSFAKRPDYICSFEIILQQLATAHIPSLKNRVSLLSCLENNWDGYGATKVSEKVLKNTYKFMDTVCKTSYYLYLTDENILLTPYGSIILDFKSNNGVVSIEIGSEKIGFFTDFNSNDNVYSDGILTDFRSIPQAVLEKMAKL